MSNAYAIAAVTMTLQGLLIRALDPLSVSDVTTLPLDKARTNAVDQLNLFLYNTSVDAQLRNSPPRTSRPGESGEPALPLRLYYLVTAYGQGDDDTRGHKLLGHAISALHDRPLLDRDEILNATHTLTDSDLHMQVERVRITPQSLNADEMSKLWMTFQTQFRISAAYEVSVVLIDSRRPARAALPVLGRGSEADTGITSTADVDSPFPSLSSAATPDPSALLPGETLVLRGSNLAGTSVAVRIKHQLMEADRVLTPLAGATARELRVVVPDLHAVLPAGFYTVAVDVGTDETTQHGVVNIKRTTNRLAFALAPGITSPMPTSAPRDLTTGDATLTLTCKPDAQPGQRVALMLGDREIPARHFNTPTSTLHFDFSNPPPGVAAGPFTFYARLRVDGVDSLFVNRAASPPEFRASQQVTIT
jgi:Pvc16 N-terminal domain